MTKNLRGLGKERRLIFLWLVLFLQRGTGYETLTSSVYVFTTVHHSHLPLAGHAPHVSYFVPKVISKYSTKPNQRPKGEMGDEQTDVSKFCKNPLFLCLSAQERLITTRISRSELEC